MLADAKDPVQAFYNSEFTEKIALEFKEHGGYLTKEDFAQYSSIVRGEDEVIYTYLKNGRRICGPPPPSGSAVTQGILNILDQ